MDNNISKEKRHKIAILISDTNAGGLAIMEELIVKNIQRDKYQVIAVAFGKGAVAERIGKYSDEYYNLETGSFPRVTRIKGESYLGHFAAYFKLVFWFVRSIWRFYRFIRANDIDLIHSHGVHFNIIAGFAGKMAGVPSIWHIHEVQKFSLLRADWLLFRGYLASIIADRFIAVSKYAARTFHKSWKSKERVILNAVDFQKVANGQKKGALRQMIGASDNEKIVGVIAVVSARKGLTRFVEVAAEIAHRHKNVRFVLIGGIANQASDRMFDDLVKKTKEMGAEHKIYFIRDLADAYKYMGDMDVFFMCSLPGAETFGLVVAEAMAAAVPVVAFANDAMPEIVKEGRTGFLVKEGDVNSAVKKILKIIDDDDLAKFMGNNAQQVVKEEFDIAALINNLQQLYSEVLDESKKG